jgi:hypothetical protein
MRSPLFLLGISSTAAPASSGGRRSMLAPWIGGAAATAVAPETAGVRSLLAFWAGGALSGSVAIASGTTPGTNDDSTRLAIAHRDQRRNRIRRDDEELAQLLAIISTHL